jgi:hypothetical protein
LKIAIETGLGRTITIQNNSKLEAFLSLNTPDGRQIDAAMTAALVDDLIDALEKIRTEIEG